MNNIRKPKLKIISEENGSAVFVLERERHSCGRCVSSDIVLADDSVSSKHCEFLRDKDTYVIRNMDRKNDTKVNNIRIHEHILKDGDVIQIGGVKMLYQDVELDNENISSLTGISFDSLETDVQAIPGMKNISPFADDDGDNKLVQTAIVMAIGFLGLIALVLFLWLVVISV